MIPKTGRVIVNVSITSLYAVYCSEVLQGVHRGALFTLSHRIKRSGPVVLTFLYAVLQLLCFIKLLPL